MTTTKERWQILSIWAAMLIMAFIIMLDVNHIADNQKERVKFKHKIDSLEGVIADQRLLLYQYADYRAHIVYTDSLYLDSNYVLRHANGDSAEADNLWREK